MARKYTRKQLKKPDEFIAFSHRVWAWAVDHATRVAAMVIAAAVVVAGAWTWSYLADKREQKATATLTRALEIYDQTVIPSAEKLPPTKDGIPRFKTRKAKLEAAEQEFGTIVKEYAGRDVGRLAQLMRASARYRLGKYKAAAADYQAFLARNIGDEQDGFRVAAIEGLIYCYEALKMWAEAMQAAGRLPRQGEQRFSALYQEARILMAKGDKQAAAKRYKEIVEKASARSLVRQAGEQLALLANSQPQP